VEVHVHRQLLSARIWPPYRRCRPC
jgi:hypothetical protein